MTLWVVVVIMTLWTQGDDALTKVVEKEWNVNEVSSKMECDELAYDLNIYFQTNEVTYVDYKNKMLMIPTALCVARL